jgi:hypothetical protein
LDEPLFDFAFKQGCEQVLGAAASGFLRSASCWQIPSSHSACVDAAARLLVAQFDPSPEFEVPLSSPTSTIAIWE